MLSPFPSSDGKIPWCCDEFLGGVLAILFLLLVILLGDAMVICLRFVDKFSDMMLTAV